MRYANRCLLGTFVAVAFFALTDELTAQDKSALIGPTTDCEDCNSIEALAGGWCHWHGPGGANPVQTPRSDFEQGNCSGYDPSSGVLQGHCSIHNSCSLSLSAAQLMTLVSKQDVGTLRELLRTSPRNIQL